MKPHHKSDASQGAGDCAGRRWLLQTPAEEEEDLEAFFFLLWVWSAL